MCGRFAFYSPREAVADVFGVELPLPLEPHYNIAPTQYVVSLRVGAAGATEGRLLRWGLVPSWAKDPATGNRMINARAETLREKPSFRAAFRRRRCVVLADGFYEWQSTAGTKQPWFIARADGQPFAMAGLWEHWEHGDERLETCTIVTTRANNRLIDLHERMPVIFEPAQVSDWLFGDDPDALQAMLKPCADKLLALWPVSRRVNNPRHDEPELVDAVNPD